MGKWGTEGREERRTERVWQANTRVKFGGRKMRIVTFASCDKDSDKTMTPEGNTN